LPSPKFKFGGHRGSTEYAQFNSNGEYIATLDEYSLKIWSTSFAKLDSDGNLQNEILVGSIPHRITYPELEPQIEIPRCSKSQASMRTPTQQSLQTFLSPSATDENKRPRPWKDTNTK
jgi:hypothetical protein